MANLLRAWGPAAAWAAALFLLSARPDVGVPVTFPWGDKIGHLVLFGILGAALAYGRVHARRAPTHLTLILTGSLYGLADEWHQSFVPGRDASAGDLLADVTGVVLGYGLVLWWYGRGRRGGAGEAGAPAEGAG